MGATFAYFSLTSNTEGTSSSTITGQTGTQEKLPSISLTGGATLSLNLADSDMAQSAEAQAKYYATTNGTPSKGSPLNHEIAEVKVKDGQAGYTYTCTAEFEITTSGTIFGELENGTLQDSDGALVITGEADNVEIADWDAATHSKSFALTSLKGKTEEGRGEKFTVTFNNLSSSHEETGLKLKADLYVENRDASQNYLANKDLTVNIKSTSFSCDTDVKAG